MRFVPLAERGMVAFYSLKEEFVLREAFRNEIVRKQFISDVTGIPMEEIRSVKQESGFLRKRHGKQKQGIMDFYMTLNNKVKINVELQLRAQNFWIKRELYYQAEAYGEELNVGENYEKLKKCISIGILDFNLAEGSKKAHARYTLRDDEGNELTDLFEIHVIQLKKEPEEGDPVGDWIHLFRADTLEKVKLFKKMRTGIKEAAITVELMNLRKDLHWYFLMLQKAKS